LEGVDVTFTADASDPDGGQVDSLVWTSSQDGRFGEGASVSRSSLSVGWHDISVVAFDDEEQTDKAVVSIRIETLPEPTITAPGDGDTFTLGELITFIGEAVDRDGGAVALSWRSSLDGFLGAGSPIDRDDLSAGDHTIWLTGVDDESQIDSTSLGITVEFSWPPTWASGFATLPTAVRAAAGTSDGSRVYVLGGNTGGYTTLNQIYDPATDAWTRGADFNGPARDYAQAAVMSDGIHLLGGTPGGTTLADHQVYNPATDTWSYRAPLPDARNAAVVEVVGDRLYVPGGGSNTGPTNWLLIYDLATDSWSTGPPMPTPRAEAASAVIDGKIYVAGGRLPNLSTTAALERYDPATNSWTVLAPMPAPRQTPGGGEIRGRFCVFGGRGAVETFCYDPDTNAWSRESDMITPRYDMAWADCGGAIYAIGGVAGGIVGTVERLR
jgi:hypothetical protein